MVTLMMNAVQHVESLAGASLRTLEMMKSSIGDVTHSMSSVHVVPSPHADRVVANWVVTKPRPSHADCARLDVIVSH